MVETVFSLLPPFPHVEQRQKVIVSPSDADFIRNRAITALAKNRVPGYNFAGLFLGLECRRYDTGGVLFDLPAGPHCADAEGTMAPAAVLYFSDMVLAAANEALRGAQAAVEAKVRAQMPDLGGLGLPGL